MHFALILLTVFFMFPNWFILVFIKDHGQGEQSKESTASWSWSVKTANIRRSFLTCIRTTKSQIAVSCINVKMTLMHCLVMHCMQSLYSANSHMTLPGPSRTATYINSSTHRMQITWHWTDVKSAQHAAPKKGSWLYLRADEGLANSMASCCWLQC